MNSSDQAVMELNPETGRYENGARDPMSDMDWSTVCAHYRAQDLTASQIAERLGRFRPTRNEKPSASWVMHHGKVKLPGLAGGCKLFFSIHRATVDPLHLSKSELARLRDLDDPGELR